MIRALLVGFALRRQELATLDVDFLGLSDRFLERDLEDAILRELATFLLEMGSGFSFVARQNVFSSTEKTSTLIFFFTTAN